MGLEADGRCRQLLSGLTCPNGIAWSDDGSIMYFIDSPERAIQVFSYNVEDGIVGEELRRIDTSELDAVPDGCCLDAEGRLWVAFWGGSCVRCYDLENDTVIAHIDLPASQITACALYPSSATTSNLFITSAALEQPHQSQAGNCFETIVTATALPAAQAAYPAVDLDSEL